MIICDCESVEIIHDAACSGATGWMILECPMCEVNVMVEMGLREIRRWDDEIDDWGEPEKIEIQ